jgi:hypothetical protein
VAMALESCAYVNLTGKREENKLHFDAFSIFPRRFCEFSKNTSGHTKINVDYGAFLIS